MFVKHLCGAAESRHGVRAREYSRGVAAFSAAGYSGSVWLQCSVSIGKYVCGAAGRCAISRWLQTYISGLISDGVLFKKARTCLVRKKVGLLHNRVAPFGTQNSF